MKARFWRGLGHLLLVLFLAATILGGREVFLRDPIVVDLARRVACESLGVASTSGKPPAAPAKSAAPAGSAAPGAAPTACALQITKWESSPVGHTVLLAGGQGQIRVVCMRQFWALGDYECRLMK